MFVCNDKACVHLVKYFIVMTGFGKVFKTNTLKIW